MRALRVFIAGVALAACSCGQRNPADVMRSMRSAIAQATAIRYDFDLRVSGAQRKEQRAVRGNMVFAPHPHGMLRMEATRDPLEGKSGPPDRYVLTSDGKTVTLLSQTKRAVFTTPMHRAGGLLLKGRTLTATRPFLDEWPVSNIEKKNGFRSAGKTELGGVDCYVLRGDLPEDKLAVELVVGINDHLPRRLLMESTDRAAPGSLDLIITHLRALDRFDSADLRVDVPDGYAAREYTPGGPAVGDPAPTWTLDAGGKPISLASLRGKIVILDFWATWCGPCRGSVPELQRIYEANRTRGLEVIGATWNDQGDADAFGKQLGVTYPHAKGDAIATAYGVDYSGVPTIFVIDRNGRVADFFLGWTGEETARQLRETVSRL